MIERGELLRNKEFVGQFVDLLGMKFNKLTVISLNHIKKSKGNGGQVFWNVVCDCR
jgi:hypothetical protein